MKLNVSKGNMYKFITHTGNVIKGKCSDHDCSYCYMKKWGNLNPVRFDEKELKIGMGSDKFIFVGSSCDMFARNIPVEWIYKTLDHCKEFDNKYFFQTKNPLSLLSLCSHLPENSVVCTTIETNRKYIEMGNAPDTYNRAVCFSKIPLEKYVTIEPILDFDLNELVELIKLCRPMQVNIGADTGGHKMPEPGKEKIFELITELEKFTKVELKKNLNRLMR